MLRDPLLAAPGPVAPPGGCPRVAVLGWGAPCGPGDVVREPFGGLASASVAAVALSRRPCVAETDEHFARLAGNVSALLSGNAMLMPRAKPHQTNAAYGHIATKDIIRSGLT
jgi:hypothetical protein